MASTQGDRKYDLVVFGATGFTGQFVVEELARTVGEERRVTWAVAGRDMSRLQDVLRAASKKTGMYDCRAGVKIRSHRTPKQHSVLHE